jgi:hypothetical protein
MAWPDHGTTMRLEQHTRSTDLDTPSAPGALHRVPRVMNTRFACHGSGASGALGALARVSCAAHAPVAGVPCGIAALGMNASASTNWTISREIVQLVGALAFMPRAASRLCCSPCPASAPSKDAALEHQLSFPCKGGARGPGPPLSKDMGMCCHLVRLCPRRQMPLGQDLPRRLVWPVPCPGLHRDLSCRKGSECEKPMRCLLSCCPAAGLPDSCWSAVLLALAAACCPAAGLVSLHLRAGGLEAGRPAVLPACRLEACALSRFSCCPAAGLHLPAGGLCL